MNKIEESLNISEDILTDLELNRISLEQICLKCLTQLDPKKTKTT